MNYFRELKFTDLNQARKKQEELVDKGYKVGLQYKMLDNKPINIVLTIRG